MRMTRYRLTFLAGLPLCAIALGQSNIDNTVPDKYAWSENAGWINWRDADGAADGVMVGNFVMRGYIWAENLGFINVGDGTPTSPPYYANANGTDFGVNIDPDGDLHGYAWGENVGWINFDGGAMATPAQPARILCASLPGQPLARLTGYVWGENIGWVNLSEATAGKFVAVDAASTPILCDVNQDGSKNGKDVQPFVTLLVAGGASWRNVCAADQPPANGTIDLGDVGAFVACLLAAP